MKAAFIILLILLLFISLFPLSVKAMEVDFEGQQDFWTNFSFKKEDQDTKISFGQSIELYIDGQEETNYVRGYLTNHPQLTDQIYLDILLDDYALELNRFSEAFQTPSWFNLQQNFSGLRLGYLGQKDSISLIGMQGENILRKDYIFLQPGDEVYGIGLYHAPVVLDSVKVWLDNRELHFGEDYYVMDYQLGVLALLIPIEKASVLTVEYLEEGAGYLIFGSRYDRNFGPKLDGGIMGLLVHNAGTNHGLLASEWLAQITPWWVMELNTGLVLEKATGIYGANLNPEEGLSVEDSDKIFDRKLNWRLAQRFNWPMMDLALEYQVIESNLQSLLYGGKTGKILTLDGQVDLGNLLIHYREDYQWSLDDLLNQKDGELEVVYFADHWIPYCYYAYNERFGLTRRYFIGEIGYLRELAASRGSLIYQMGVEVTTTPQEELHSNVEPYFGVRYQRNEDDNLGVKVYGRQGWQFAQLLIDGNWRQGFLNWNGQLIYQPDYYRLEQAVSWDQYPVDVNFSLIHSRYPTRDQGYLNLELYLDWSKLTEAEAMLWLSLLNNQVDHQEVKTYQLGFEKALNTSLVGYGELSYGDQESSYFVGVYSKGQVGFDLNYTRSADEELVNDQFIMVKRDRLAFSLGVMDSWNVYSEVVRDNLHRWWNNLGVKYPVAPDLELGIQYSLEKELDDHHQLTVRTTYYF